MSDAAARDEFAPDSRVAGCVVERVLGRGASGVVYLARTAEGERVALKVLHREALDAPGAVTRFEREARALRAVRHEALAPLVLAGRLDDGRPYLATRWIDGETLRERLRAKGRIDPREAWSWLERVGLALVAAHDAGVVHRDLKPENIVIDATGAAHLLDFGIARTPRDLTDAKLTATGVPLGTPAYMSPEQWWNQSVDAATDQYALGVMAFEMLAGRLPFAEERYVAMMQAHLASDPPSLSSVGVTVPDAMEAWVARLLAKDRASRFESMRAAIDAGRAAFVGESPKHAAREHRTLPVGIALSIGLSLVGIGYVGSHSPRYWAYLGGFALYPVFVAWLVALFALARGAHRLATWSTVAAIVSGSLGTYTGWQAVLHHLGRYPAAQHFELFNDGMSEANANRFVAFGAASSVCVAMSWRRFARSSRDGAALAIASAVFAVIAALLGASGAAFVAGVTALAALSRGAIGPTRADVLRDEAPRIAGAVAAVVCAIARSEARESALWANAPSRAARVAEIVTAASDRDATWAASGAVLVAMLATAAWRWRRSALGATRVASQRQWAIALSCAALFVVGDAYFHAQVRSRRADLWAAMAPRFALFARLDPPTMEGLPAPRLVPTLQIARDVIAIDGERVGLTAGLDAAEGRSALGADLAHRLAREATPALALMADRHVRRSTVSAALRVAYAIGVREVDVVFTRGAAPQWRGTAPTEASYALPRDFGLAHVRLDADGNVRGDVVDRWTDADGIGR